MTHSEFTLAPGLPVNSGSSVQGTDKKAEVSAVIATSSSHSQLHI